ncbi:MAG: 8-oxo-dGTP diphosphatase MutT, partial [Pseudomonadota bacterium]
MSFIHVVAGVVTNDQGDILLGLRHKKSHQGGLWEFPGGKLESNESPFQALQREFHEEIGIDIQTARPLIQIRHDYGDKQVLLDVWRALTWSGQAQGREGQQIQWCSPAALSDLSMPAANLPIVHAAQLPERYLITPEPLDLTHLEQALQQGIRLVQLRANLLGYEAYQVLAQQVVVLCQRYQARVLL